MRTRDDARREVIDAIEANGTDVATRDQFDVDSILDEAFDDDYHQVVDVETFWQIVKRYAYACPTCGTNDHTDDEHDAIHHVEDANQIDWKD